MIKFSNNKAGRPTPRLRFEIDEFLRDVDFLQRQLINDRTIISAIRRVGRKIVKDSKTLYKARWPKANSKKHGDAMTSGLRDWLRTYRKTGNKYVLISTYGNRKPGSRSYMLSFFEGGTVERKKGDRTFGRIKPVGAFTDTLMNSRGEFESAVSEAIHKILNKKR